MYDREVVKANELIVKEPIARIQTIYQGFKVLTESFAIGLKEFEQIFSFPDPIAVFNVWDHNQSGMIDCIEFFTVLIVFAKGRLEDKIRFLFNLFDFNARGYLEEVDLHFIAFNVITVIVKLFGIDSHLP